MLFSPFPSPPFPSHPSPSPLLHPHILTLNSFTPVITPDVVHPALVEACGFQPRGEGSQVYWVRDHELCLVGTSEISLASMHINQTYDLSKAPIKLVGFSHCFRAETGGGTYPSINLLPLSALLCSSPPSLSKYMTTFLSHLPLLVLFDLSYI